MKPVYQTRYGNEGNCLAACIASILEVPLVSVDFTASEGTWLDKCQEKLKPLGFYYLGFTKRNGEPMNIMVIPDGAYCIFVGPTERDKSDTLLHCVVGQMVFKGEMKDKDHPIVHFQTVHDPNKLDQPGLLGGMPTELGFLVPFGPRTHNESN